MFEIYGRNNCVWCDRAKELLTEHNLLFVFLNIEEDKEALKNFKWYFSGATTVPKIRWYDHEAFAEDNSALSSELIGGYKELYEWLRPSINKS